MTTPDELWLSDLTVLDLSRLLPGPFCTMLLGDMGADVLKVEAPNGGDYARYYPPMVDGQSAFFGAINRNKRSLTVDLKSDRGVDVFDDLVAEADVVVESFRPGVANRLGVSYERLSQRNERLIYCSMTGYGQTGPLSQRAGHDLNYLARAGLLDQNGSADKPPQMPGFQVADLGGALYAAIGILGALHSRHRAGVGSYVDISMTEGALSFQAPVHASVAAGGRADRGEGLLSGGAPSYNIYETRDGRYLAVAALEPKFWMRFVQAIGAPDLADGGMDTGARGGEVGRSVAKALGGETLEHWLKVFGAVDVCVEPVQSPVEALDDELFKAREMFFDLAGVHHTCTPVTPDQRRHQPAPGLGEHTDEVLAELGYADTAIARLHDADVV